MKCWVDRKQVVGQSPIATHHGFKNGQGKALEDVAIKEKANKLIKYIL